MISDVHGNLLDAEADALVNTVNTVGVMGKGIALQFKNAYPDNFQAYRAACQRHELRAGHMFVFDVGQLLRPRWIVNFPTKRHWRSPSRLADIEAGLDDLRCVIQERNIRSIAVPPLGCGNGGLRWTDVRPLIERSSAISICTSCSTRPRDAPRPTEPAHGSVRLHRTPNVRS